MIRGRSTRNPSKADPQLREKANARLLQATIYAAAFPGLVVLGLLNSGHEYLANATNIARCLHSAILCIFLSCLLHGMISYADLNFPPSGKKTWLSPRSKNRLYAFVVQVVSQLYLVCFLAMMLNIPLIIVGSKVVYDDVWYVPVVSDAIANFQYYFTGTGP